MRACQSPLRCLGDDERCCLASGSTGIAPTFELPPTLDRPWTPRKAVYAVHDTREHGVAGLGCGGNSRIGLGTGKSEAESIELVRAAVDLGITYFDTAALYGTEPILGRAFRPGERSKVVISLRPQTRHHRIGSPEVSCFGHRLA